MYTINYNFHRTLILINEFLDTLLICQWFVSQSIYDGVFFFIEQFMYSTIIEIHRNKMI